MTTGVVVLGVGVLATRWGTLKASLLVVTLGVGAGVILTVGGATGAVVTALVGWVLTVGGTLVELEVDLDVGGADLDDLGAEELAAGQGLDAVGAGVDFDLVAAGVPGGDGAGVAAVQVVDDDADVALAFPEGEAAVGVGIFVDDADDLGLGVGLSSEDLGDDLGSEAAVEEFAAGDVGDADADVGGGVVVVLVGVLDIFAVGSAIDAPVDQEGLERVIDGFLGVDVAGAADVGEGVFTVGGAVVVAYAVEPLSMVRVSALGCSWLW